MSSKNSPQQSPSQDEEGGFPKGQIWTEDSGCTGARFSHGIPPCSMKGRSESSGVGVASGQFSPSMSFWILPWKEIFLVVSLDLLCPFLIFLLNPCLSLNTGPKHRHCFSKIGENKSHCLIPNELRKKDSD